MAITLQVWLSIFNEDPMAHLIPCQSEAQQIFAALDINGDAEISHQEWSVAFQRIDADGNGSISRQEWQMRFGSARIFDSITLSMQLTRSDWITLFTRIDANNDGKITFAEWLEMFTNSTVQHEATKVFNILDQDNNSMITQREWLSAFHLIDVNSDGHLARAEWLVRFGSQEIFNMISGMSSLYMTMDQWLAAFDRFVAMSSVVSVPRRPSQIAGPFHWTSSMRSAPLQWVPSSRIQPQPVQHPWQRSAFLRIPAPPTSIDDLQKEACQVFRHLDLDCDGRVTAYEWMQALDFLDTDRNGSISRKEWYMRHGSMEVYDSIPKTFWGNMTRQEWRDAFTSIDTNNDGSLSLSEWLMSLRAMSANVPQSTAPMGIHDWAQGSEDRQGWVSRRAML